MTADEAPAINYAHNEMAEQSLLGCILIDNTLLPEIRGVIEPTDFYDLKHQMLYRAMLRCDNEHRNIDPPTLLDFVDLKQLGGARIFDVLEGSVFSTKSAAQHARIIKEHSLKRQLRQKLQEHISGNSDDSVEDQIAQIQNALHEIKKDGFGTIRHVAESATDTMDWILTVKEQGTVSGVPFTAEVDHYTSGWQPGELIILAARPSVGKTAFASEITRAAVLKNHPALFFSLEMGERQLMQRIACRETRIPLNKIRDPRYLNPDEIGRIDAAYRKLSGEWPLFIDESPGLDISLIRSRTREMKLRRPELALVVVDYLQLITRKDGRRNDNREVEVASISKALKQIARENEVPVIALSQLSRNVEHRKGGPQLSDLRESGAIEQDADIVMFLHREERAEPGEAENIELLIEKNRQGSCGHQSFKFFGENMEFVVCTSEESNAKAKRVIDVNDQAEWMQ